MKCSIDGCDKPVKARRLCTTHYARLLRHGDPLVTINTFQPKECSDPNCTRRAVTRGLCATCYARARYHSDLTVRSKALERARRQRQQQGYAPRLAPLPTAPLHELIESLVARIDADSPSDYGRTYWSLAKHFGISGKRLKMIMDSETLSVFMADNIACKFGKHPIEIWGDQWLEVAA